MDHDIAPHQRVYPGDIARAYRADMTGPGPIRDVDAQQVVVVAVDGAWRLAVLTKWRRLPNGSWVAHIRWARTPRDPVSGWAWVQHDPSRLIPLDGESLTAAGLI